MQQQPTLRNIWIRSTRDAMHIFYGVACRLCPMVTRRLDAEERRAIAPGNVYVWEERGANSEATGLGMERWTDGLSWGPSRVRDEFLFYHEKDPDTNEDTQDPSTRWALRRGQASRPPQPSSSPPAARNIAPQARSRSGRGPAREPLIKQTYSVHVSLPQDRPKGITRKWHLTAYFSQESIDTLDTVDSIAGLGTMPVPDGWFRSARAGARGRRGDRNTEPMVGPDGFLPLPGPSAHLVHGVPPPGYPDPMAYYGQHPPAGYPGGYYAPPPPPHAYYHAIPQYGYREHDAEGGSPRSSPSLSSSSVSSDTNGSALVAGAPPYTLSAAYTRPRTAHPGAVSLVPLQDLQEINGPRRDPIDEELLRRFDCIR